MQPEAPVFQIQRFSLHDGPGIRSLVFLKGCAFACPWCQNPEAQSTRPVIGFYRDRCLGSFECETACPDGAILRDGHRVDYDNCNSCGLCVDACATGALRLIGETLTSDEVMERLLTDRAYYERSGGGVTFTGGEPTLHPEFVRRMVESCIEEGIHTNMETAGRFSWEAWEPILRLFDLIYFDLKILDEAGHERYIGTGFRELTTNAERLVAGGFPVVFRMPLVSGFTDTNDNLDSVIAFLHRIGQPAVHLLKYHNMGEAKIGVIQGPQLELGLEAYPDDRLAEVCRTFRAAGVAAVVYD